MSTTMKHRLRKLLVLAASATGLLAWAAAAAAQPVVDPPKPTVEPPPARPDSGEPRDKPELLTPSSTLLLPDTWAKPDELLQAAVELNSRLAQAERGGKLVPWDLADQIRKSLSAGRELAPKLEGDGRIPYYQVLCMAARAAGHPDDAMFAARELTKLDAQQPAFWKLVYQAGMLQGDKAACTEAVGKIGEIIKRPDLMQLMKDEADPIGKMPDCELTLSDKTTLNPAKAPGKVVVVDFWMYTDKLSKESRPYIRYAYDMFKHYPAFRMVGVNMDKKEYKSLAASFAQVNNMEWPSHFEGQVDRPISFGAFAVRRLPTVAVVSPGGQIIFSGEPRSNPEFFYAIRTGLITANKGKIPSSQPDAKAGADPDHKGPPVKPATPDDPKAHGPPSVGVAKPTVPAPDKVQQEKDATEQLKIAEAFIAAGARDRAIEIYKEIGRKYPNTTAAMKASVELLALEP